MFFSKCNKIECFPETQGRKNTIIFYDKYVWILYKPSKIKMTYNLIENKHLHIFFTLRERDWQALLSRYDMVFVASSDATRLLTPSQCLITPLIFNWAHLHCLRGYLLFSGSSGKEELAALFRLLAWCLFFYLLMKSQVDLMPSKSFNWSRKIQALFELTAPFGLELLESKALARCLKHSHTISLGQTFNKSIINPRNTNSSLLVK